MMSVSLLRSCFPVLLRTPLSTASPQAEVAVKSCDACTIPCLPQRNIGCKCMRSQASVKLSLPFRDRFGYCVLISTATLRPGDKSHYS